jgi:hypothetical protein
MHEGNAGIFAGRGFSHAFTEEKSARLQPLKYRCCVCRSHAVNEFRGAE